MRIGFDRHPLTPEIHCHRGARSDLAHERSAGEPFRPPVAHPVPAGKCLLRFRPAQARLGVSGGDRRIALHGRQDLRRERDARSALPCHFEILIRALASGCRTV